MHRPCRHSGADGADIGPELRYDEYDNFANTILAYRGAEAYHSFIHGGGFYRNFFATLKGGAGHGGIERLFITGVSPMTMDDVASGFNIGGRWSTT
ncbi:MAG: AAA family ATPase [Spirochaetaceae bacterium]|nr:AAA family ATPase [Spirochaetaceae bacterium]